MARKKISFDVDGVLAEGGWVPVEERTNKVYCAKRPAHIEVIPSLQWLSTQYDIYVISTRGHEDANLGLRAWLHWVLGVELDTIAGVITHPWSDAKVKNDPDGQMDKARIVKDLGIVVHFDDAPEHIEAMPGYGVLVPSDMPSSIAATNRLPTAPDWDTIRAFLTTPGMVLHGTNGTSVTSPAEEFREDFKQKVKEIEV